MQKQAPTSAGILVMAVFALSCFGLLLFLWLAFGGPVPLKPKGYRFNGLVRRGHAARPGGRRADLRRHRRQGQEDRPDSDGRTDATIELQQKYAPMPEDTPRDPAPEDAARRDLRRAHARHQERAEDPRERRACATRSRSDGRARRDLPLLRPEDARGFQVWQQDLGAGIRAAARTSQDALGNLTPFAENTTSCCGS